MVRVKDLSKNVWHGAVASRSSRNNSKYRQFSGDIWRFVKFEAKTVQDRGDGMLSLKTAF